VSSPLDGAVSRIVVLRPGEAPAALLMFAYSFLAMTSHNVLYPITRSKVIEKYGADNVPWIMLGAGLLIGVLMHQYTRLMKRLPRESVLPVTQAGLILLMVAFWALLRTGLGAVPVALFLFGQILGVLLISQFWTLANDIYDPRQAKRLFGFIGGGASLGGALGSGLTTFLVGRIGNDNLLLVSAAALALCLMIVATIIRRRGAVSLSLVEDEQGVGAADALRLLAQSPHLRVIALVIGLAAAGSTIIEQQLLMMAEASGRSAEGITAFLAAIRVYISLAGFLVQVGLTSRIHRSLGLAVALLLLPLNLGATAAVVLISGAAWAPAVARVFDTTLRYTVDKTTREILFLPLPTDIKYRAKPFIDVTMDRFSKALASIVLLVLVQPWGLDLDWRYLSYASLAVMAIWIAATLVARREYLTSFRRSIGAMTIAPDAIRADVTDAATIETLVEELSNPDEAAVLYAITMLETLDKRNLITPLLLQHSSAQVRTRALMALSSTRFGRKWVTAIERLVQDADVDVRAAALRALAAISHEDAAALMRRHLDDPEPRVAVAAATALADSGDPADAKASELALRRLIADTRDAAAFGRIECANALAHIRNPQFRSLLVPLLYDHDTRVVQEAIRSARRMGASDGLFLPGLLSLLGHRLLKADARDTLVGYGEPVVGALAHALRDRREHIWLRRHIPATLALIPSQQSMDELVASLEEPDGFLRYKAIAAIERLTREHPHIGFPHAAVEKLLVQETSRYYNCLTLHYNLLQHAAGSADSLLGRAITDKMARALDRIYRLLGLLYQVDDIAAARYTIEQGEARRRAQAIEYLDNLLGGMVRRRVLPILDDTPLAEKVRHANGILKSRPREVEDTLAQLIHDDDPVVAASAIHYVATRGIWSLAGDIEYAATRRTDDAAVGQAALWALLRKQQGQTLPLTAAESIPAVELADRVRAIALFQYVSVDELFRIAEVGEEVRYPVGRELRRTDVAADVEFLIDGRVERDGAIVTPPAVLGLEEVLQGSPTAPGLIATEPTVCFRIAGPDFLTMLSDNVLLAEGLFRMLLAPADRVPPLLLPARAPDAIARTQTAHAVDLVLVLRHHPLFERATAAQLLALTAAASVIVLTEGTTLFGPDDLPAIHVVLEGEVVIDTPLGDPIVAPLGSTIGVAETLAGVSSGTHARVSRSGRALRLDRERLFGVLGDEVELMQGLFSGVLMLRRKMAELT
jgi:AAA family ATP:ADP antiporter